MLAGYRVLGQLGRGGMAEVLRVQDAAGNSLALKRLIPPPGPAAGAAARWQFQREYHTLCQLSHPAIVGVHDYGFVDGDPFYTMDVLAGCDLVELGVLPWRRACRVAHGVASALAVLHARRLLHRDVSTRNIRVSEDGAPILLDFGAMAPMGHCQEVIGTPPFVAPEALYGQSLDGRLDLYAVGACLYWMLTGRHAFAARTLGALQLLWEQPLEAPGKGVGDVPPALDALVLALLDRRPAARPSGAGELMDRLAAIAGLEVGAAAHATHPPSEGTDTGPKGGAAPGKLPSGASQAYLVTPPLVGRDAPLAAFLTQLQWAQAGQGRSVCLRADAGVGRSRMLDACVLEARLAGVPALRVSAVTDGADLTAALGGALRQHPQGRAFSSGVGGHVLRDLRRAAADAPLLVAVDDLDRAALPALEVLRRLTQGQWPGALLLLMVSDYTATAAAPAAVDRGPESGERAGADAARAALLQAAEPIELPALGPGDSEQLLRMVFGAVPHLKLLSTRLHRASLGLPRALMDIAQHMVDTGRIRHLNGDWVLPARLRVKDVPRRPRELDAVRLRALSADATMLARVLSLRPDGAFALDELLAMVADGDSARLLDGLDALMRAGVIELQGTRCAFTRTQWASAFSAGLGADALQQGHRRMARGILAHCGATDPQRLVAAEHLMAATDGADALEVAAGYAHALLAEVSFPGAAVTAPPPRALQSLEAFYLLGVRRERPMPERLAMLQVLVMGADSVARVGRYGPTLLTRLALDSGLTDLAKLDTEATRRPGPSRHAAAESPTVAGPAGRLRLAQRMCDRRHDAALSMDQGFDRARAMALLGPVATHCLRAALAGWHAGLLRACPDTTPLAPESPGLGLLGAFRDATGATFRGRPAESLLRLQALLARLDAHPEQPPWLPALRRRVVYRLGLCEAALGIDAARGQAEWLEAQPGSAAQAHRISRVFWLACGDQARAAAFAERIELARIEQDSGWDEGPAEQMAEAWLSHRLGDVTALKRLVAAGRRALSERGGAPEDRAPLLALQALCEGLLASASGDTDAALASLAEAAGYRLGSAAVPASVSGGAGAASGPSYHPVAPAALYALAGVLLDAGRLGEARALLADLAELGSGGGSLNIDVQSQGRAAWSELDARLALLEGDASGALQHCERGLAICRALGRRGEYPGALHAVAARAAAALGDASLAARLLEACAQFWDTGEQAVLGMRHERLVLELGDAAAPAGAATDRPGRPTRPPITRRPARRGR